MAGGKTRIERTTRRMPMSRLGPPSSLPRFRWQQPIADTNTPPNRGLSPEESSHGFQWGKDSILPYRVFDDYDRDLADADDPLRGGVLGRHPRPLAVVPVGQVEGFVHTPIMPGHLFSSNTFFASAAALVVG